MHFPSAVLLLSALAFCIGAQGNDEPISVLIERGNDMLSRGKTSDALTIFTNAIQKDNSNYLTYYKRATTYLAMSRYSAALSDFTQVLKLKPDFPAALSQRGKVMSSLGQWDAALADLTALGDRSAAVVALQSARKAASTAEKSLESGALQACVEQATIAITTASASSSLRRLRARCQVMQGDADSAIADLVFATRVNPSDADVLMLSANLFFFALNDQERAIQQLKTCLHYDPDAKACKKSFRSLKKLHKSIEGVKKSRDSKQWVSSRRTLKGSAEEPGLLAQLSDTRKQLSEDFAFSDKLHLQTFAFMDELACEVFAETKDAGALEKCDLTLAVDAQSVTALRSKASVLLRDEHFDQAIELLNRANDLTGGQDHAIREQLGKAHKLLKISKQKDYYKVLGVSREADQKTIKKRYRTLTKEFHPDKYRGDLSPEQVIKNFEGINEAYEVLANPELRQRFDNGDGESQRAC